MTAQLPTSTARITAVGTYLPEKILTNDELEQLVETSDEWIVQRTGIKERRISEPEQFTSHLCIEAIKNLQIAYDKQLEDVDFIIVATSTPDFGFPSIASQIQAHFGMSQTGAVDLSATCAGFVYGLHLANGLITSGLHRKILVLGADTMSKITDYTDRSTCILFGDGAGAVLLEHDPQQPSFLPGAYFSTEGEKGIHVYRSGLSTAIGETALSPNGCIVQNGKEVYKWAVSSVPQGMKTILEQAGLTMQDIAWFVPHSANLKIIESICDKSGFPIDRLRMRDRDRRRW